MLEDQSESDQLAAIYGLDAKLRAKRRKQRENKKSKKKMKGLELDPKCSSGPGKTPENSELTGHVNFVALPDTSEIDLQKDDGTDNINATSLVIEVQTGDGGKLVEGHNSGKRDSTCVKSDSGINGGNYVYRTKAEEYKMIAELGMRSQLSAMISPEARTKNAQRNERKRENLVIAPTDVIQSSEVQKKNCVEGVVEVTNGDDVRPDTGVYKYRTKAEEYRMLANTSNCSQDVTLFAREAAVMGYRTSNKNKGMGENQNSAVACVADVQRGNILKALETTKEINTNDVLRSALVIDPGLSFSEGCEENACLENTEGNPEIEQTEAPVREEEEVFDRRDGDIAAEIVKLEDSTNAAETASSLKLGSMKKEENFMLRKLLRKPRYYDPGSSLQMCHNCGEDDHKVAECTMVRKKKPCYICGGFRHTAKRCNQGRECFKCGGRGHLARDCLEEPVSNNISDFCLRCGDSGHHMFICQSDYSSEDLKAMQCYVCKEFGHLCCEGFKYEGQTAASCYKCGQSGHLGSECIRQEKPCIRHEKRTRYSQAKSFYNREVNGHFAGKRGEYNKAGQCESTTVGRSFSDKEIIPNFPSNQRQRQDKGSV